MGVARLLGVAGVTSRAPGQSSVNTRARGKWTEICCCFQMYSDPKRKFQTKRSLYKWERSKTSRLVSIYHFCLLWQFSNILCYWYWYWHDGHENRQKVNGMTCWTHWHGAWWPGLAWVTWRRCRWSRDPRWPGRRCWASSPRRGSALPVTNGEIMCFILWIISKRDI